MRILDKFFATVPPRHDAENSFAVNRLPVVAHLNRSDATPGSSAARTGSSNSRSSSSDTRSSSSDAPKTFKNPCFSQIFLKTAAINQPPLTHY
jgi:hypothetical protein